MLLIPFSFRNVALQMQLSRIGRLAGLAVIAVLVGNNLASATDQPPLPVEELARTCDAFVMGRVVDVQVAPTGPHGQPGIHTRAVIEVAFSLGGPVADSLGIWVQGGRYGDQMRVVVGQPVFRPGQRVAVFAMRDGNGVLWPYAFSRSTWLVDEDGGVTWIRPSRTSPWASARHSEEARSAGRSDERQTLGRFLSRVATAFGATQ